MKSWNGSSYLPILKNDAIAQSGEACQRIVKTSSRVRWFFQAEADSELNTSVPITLQVAPMVALCKHRGADGAECRPYQWTESRRRDSFSPTRPLEDGDRMIAQ